MEFAVNNGTTQYVSFNMTEIHGHNYISLQLSIIKVYLIFL